MAREPPVPSVPLKARVHVDVPFQDSDPMGVTWHGNYFRYLESARAVLLANIGYGYRDMIASGYLWPIVEAQIKYLKPTVFGQRLTVTAELTEYENRLRIAYTIVDHDSGECVTKAHTTQVAVAKESGEMCFCSPQVFIDKVRACADARASRERPAT
jgi:acyl-CoA thioester hydrolase